MELLKDMFRIAVLAAVFVLVCRYLGVYVIMW